MDSITVRLLRTPMSNLFAVGSSAGAGSEVFHVYRHLRRRENTRQQYISDQATKEDKDREFEEKADALKAAAELRTAKKRVKRFVGDTASCHVCIGGLSFTNCRLLVFFLVQI